MGLFDEIRCEYPLPYSGYQVPPEHIFQTKSLECMGDNYTITADGRLILHRKRYGSLRAVPPCDEELFSCHGEVRFYDAVAVRGEPGRVWIEYKAHFTEGRLSLIEVANVHDLPKYKNAASSRGPVVERDSDAPVEGD